MAFFVQVGSDQNMLVGHGESPDVGCNKYGFSARNLGCGAFFQRLYGVGRTKASAYYVT